MAETNTQKMLRALLKPAAHIEQMMLAVLLMTSVDTALGVWLDVIGDIVGEERAGEPDDEIYRRRVRSKIAVNKSDGVTNDILLIARLIVPEAPAGTIVNYGGLGAAYVLVIEGVAISEDVARVLVRHLLAATSDGVRAIVGWTQTDPEAALYWDDGDWDDFNWWHSTDEEI